MVLPLPIDDTQFITYDLSVFRLFQYAALERRIQILIDGQPVHVEAAIQTEIVLQMTQAGDPLGQSLVMPALQCLVPHAHLHERDAIHCLKIHVAQKALALIHRYPVRRTSLYVAHSMCRAGS